MLYKNKKALFDEMQKIVDDTMTMYQSDFDIDKDIINRSGDNTFVWMVREHGTHIIRLTNSVDPLYYVNAVYNNTTIDKMYIVSVWDDIAYLDHVTLDDISGIIEENEKLTIHICNAPFEQRTYHKTFNDCYFDNDDLLHEWIENYIISTFTPGHFKGYYYATSEDSDGISTDGYVSC